MILDGRWGDTASFLVWGLGIEGISLDFMATAEPILTTKKGVGRIIVFKMVKDDGKSPATNKAVTILLSKDGSANYESATNSVSEIGYGLYSLLLTDVELDSTVTALVIIAPDCQSKVYIIYTEETVDPADIILVKGALGFNSVMDDFTYDVNGKATAGTLYIYDTPVNALAHTSPGGTGLLKKIVGVAIITGLNTTKLTRTEE